MAQALPRFCPRCGTPTRADMHHCATCGLTVEAMLSRSGDRQSQPDEKDADETLDTISEAATIPTPSYPQQDDRLNSAPDAFRRQDSLPRWKEPAANAQALYASSTSPVPPGPVRQNATNNPSSQAGLNPPSRPGLQQWQDQGPLSPAPPAWNAPNNPSSQAGLNPPSRPGLQQWQDQGPLSPAPPASNASNNPLSQAGQQAPWSVPNPPSQSAGVEPALTKQRRLGILLVLLVILLVLGGGGYLVAALLGTHLPGLGPSQSTIKTTRLSNLAVTYAGMNVTLLSVQQAQNFIDDPQTASNGMLRLSLQEQNKTTVPISWDYHQSARLLIQGKPALAPTYVKSSNRLAPGATETSTIDFAVVNGGNLSDMIFQLGTSSEAPIQIPLNGQANLSQYQPKTIAQNGSMVYFGLNWTLTSATTGLSIPGQQAAKGMEYLTLNFSIDNTLSQEAISGSPFDYLRVQAGGKTASPISTTIPVSFATGEMGKKGSATFLIPQDSTSCTLILLSQDPGTSGQASTTVQLG